VEKNEQVDYYCCGLKDWLRLLL